MKHVPLSAIEFDSATQIRTAINNDVVIEYAQAMTDGDNFPIVTLFQVGEKYLIGDGWHRLLAAQRNGDVTVRADVFPGTRADAIKFALSANAKHGIPRTNADKKRAVELALKEFPNLSDRELANLCAVSHPFVGKVRDQLVTVTSSATPTPAGRPGGAAGGKVVEVRLGGDGKLRKLPAKARAAVARTTTPIASNARQYSLMARNALDKIEAGDPQRKDAFREVREFCTEQLGEVIMDCPALAKGARANLGADQVHGCVKTILGVLLGYLSPENQKVARELLVPAWDEIIDAK